ncbi:MAG: hypothetical protein EOM87_02500 [Clostridia bacterium]|nr:hypothetical protein [Clostridia bacterium]
MKKIVIVGIGQGGIVAAEKLSSLNYDIEVFEQRDRKNLTYDWHDDVSKKIFARTEIPLPDAKHYFEKKDWSFFAPHSEIPFKINQDKDMLDYSMERRPFMEMLISRVPDKVKINYNTKVEGLWIEDNIVKGIFVGGKQVAADLVIDSAGAKSVLRKSLPESYHIQKRAAVNELFYAYRAFFNSNEGAEVKDSNKVYLKHMGENGISWCIADPSGLVNVLIGRLGILNEYDVTKALGALREANPIIGDKVMRGGQIVCIPVRYPLTRMVGEGYLAMGDAAFMTIPMLGSGIASSMLAATLLYEVLKANPSLAIDNLWRYQVAFYRECGAKHCAVDVMKRWMISASNKDLQFMFNRGLLSHEDMKKASVGDLVTVDFKSAVQKIKIAFFHMGLLFRLGGTAAKASCANRVGLKIPAEYDAKKIARWEKRIKYFYRTKIEESPV